MAFDRHDVYDRDTDQMRPMTPEAIQRQFNEDLGDTSELEQAAVLLNRNGMDMEEVAQVICEGIFHKADRDVHDAAHEALMDAMRAAQSEVA